MLQQQRPIKCVRMVEIDLLTQFRWDMAAVFVIGVLGEKDYFTRIKTIDDFTDDSCFAGSCAARYADNYHILNCYADSAMQRYDHLWKNKCFATELFHFLSAEDIMKG